MFSVIRFIVFFPFFWLHVSGWMGCWCGGLSVYGYFFAYYLMLSCLNEAWIMYYYSRRKNDLLRYQYAFFFYMMYFCIYMMLSSTGWGRLYTYAYYEFFYWYHRFIS